MSRRGRWSRLVAMLLIAAAGVSFAPRPTVAAEHRCHGPVPQNVVTTDHDGCGECVQTACVAMSGCAHVVAVITAPPTGPLGLSDHVLAEPATRIVHDLPSRGPPTPPPNS